MDGRSKAKSALAKVSKVTCRVSKAHEFVVQTIIQTCMCLYIAVVCMGRVWDTSRFCKAYGHLPLR